MDERKPSDTVRKPNSPLLRVFCIVIGIIIALSPVALLVYFYEDLVDWSQDRNYQLLVFTLVPLVVGCLGLMAAYFLYIGIRKQRPVRRRSVNSIAFRVFSGAGIALAAIVTYLLIYNFLDDVADPGTDEYWLIGGAVIAIFTLIGGYHFFGIIRKQKTRKAVIYSAFAIFLMGGASIAIGTYQALAYTSEARGPYLSWSLDPTTTMSISWESPVHAPRELQWSNSSAFISYALITANESDYRPTTSRYHYNVTITNLLPNTTYYYRVPGFHDAITPFKTAPVTTEPFTFFAYGDSREAVKLFSEHQALINQMVGLSSGNLPAFMLNVGDIANDWDDIPSWDVHFSIIKPLAQSVPYFVATGNHEWNSGLSDAANPNTLIHEFPSTGPNQINETNYAFQYSNAYIIVLGYTHEGTSRDVRAWLEGQLAYANASASIDWIFLCWHVPPFTGTPSRGDNNNIKNNTADLLHKYGADVAFLGHDHNYQHINITHSSNYTNGVTYLITGGGGASLYDVANKTWDGTDDTGIYGEKYFGEVIVAKSTYEFVKIDVDGLQATFTAYEIGGAVIDQFTITK
nr:fibronectin type III domain-containing protein [Candidatus Sigynarchaeota archaeon]